MEILKNGGKRSLNWLTNYLETDMTYIAKNGFWLTIGQITATVLAFGLSVFFANFVSKEVYGNYKFVLSATGILGSLSLTGLGTVVIQAIARGKEGMLYEAVKTTLKWGLLILLAGVLGSIYYFNGGNTTIAVSMLIAAFCLPLINAFNLYGSYFSGKKDFKKSTLYWITTQTILNISIITTGILTKNTLALVSTYFIVNTISAIWCFWHITKKYNLNKESDDSLMLYGKHISFMNFFNAIANQLDKILVFHYLGAIDLAIYTFSQAIPEQIKGSFKNLFAIALPKYAEMEESLLRKSITKKAWQLTIISFFIVIAYIISAPIIFKILFPKYIEAVFYSQIYVLGLIAIPGLSLFSTYFQIKKATKTMYKLTTSSNVATIILSFLLIYTMGIKGAVIENGVSWFIMLGINYYFFATHKED